VPDPLPSLSQATECLCLKNFLEQIADFGFFTREQSLCKESYLRTQSSIGLRDFAADRASADQMQMARKVVDLDDRTVGEVGKGIKALDLGNPKRFPAAAILSITTVRSVTDY
jgi:hypothetical protein